MKKINGFKLANATLAAALALALTGCGSSDSVIEDILKDYIALDSGNILRGEILECNLDRETCCIGFVVSTVYDNDESQDSAAISAVPSDPIDPDDVVISSAIAQPFRGGHLVVLSIESSGLGHMYQIETSADLSAD